MFGLFKKKSKREVLDKKYRQLMEESFRLSHSDRRASDQKRMEAEEVLAEINRLGEGQ